MAHDHDTTNSYPSIRTGKNTGPQETIPQGSVRPGAPPEGNTGPNDWDDMVLHTGEARGLADTAYHALRPDAPTVGAAREGHLPEADLSVGSELPSSSNAPA